MRIAFFYPSGSINDPIDPPNIWTASRGLTGSEVACVMYATELAKLGHSVNLFTKVTRPAQKDGVYYIPYEEWASTYSQQDSWDALCSWMTPEPLKYAQSNVFRFFNQQVSDFGQCEPGWEQYVDYLAPLSHSHAHFLKDQTAFPKEKYRVLHNGTNTDQFKPGKKIPGKMIWASSHDRGLHWLLEAFPKIKEKVPRANLHIFYNFQGVRAFADWTSSEDSPRGRFIEELGRRSRYTLESIKRLEGKGVFAHESVSRERIINEMSTSEVLAYPLDPVRYTETFGVTVLEACASGTVPIICAADAFGELWGPVSESVPAPYSENKDWFIEKTINIMSDQPERVIKASKCINYAKNFEWSVLAKKLDEFLQTRGQSGLPKVNW